MTSKTKRLAASLLPLLTSISVLGACGAESEPSDGAGNGGTSGTSGSTGKGGSAGSSGAQATGGASGSAGSATAGTGTGGNAAAGTGGSGLGGAGPGTGGSGVGGSGVAGSGVAGSGAGSGGTGVGGGAGGSGAGGTGAGSGGTGTAGTGSGGTGSAGGPAGGYPENTGAGCDVEAGETMGNSSALPDPFAMNDGTRITTKAEWTCRRNEIKKDIERYEIGTKPEPPQVEATLSNNSLSVRVTTSDGSITLTSMVGMASGAGPHCVAIGMNGNAASISGCVQVPFMHDQVVGYRNGTGSQTQSDPFYTVYPNSWQRVGNYAAWSWGISRLIDGIEQVKDQLNVDTTRIGVQGCSYAGKMALFGGAFDERVALTVAQESGGGGITSWRMSQLFTDRTGVDVEKIDNTNYAWFLSSMKNLNENSLPHDHHELVAMIAPRAVIALGNPGYEWLGDESGYKSMVAAKEVYKALGVEDRIGFDFTGNHRHCQAASSQTNSVNAFVNKFLKGMNADTNIAIQPQQSGFDLNTTSAIPWQTPTLQ